MLPFTTGQLPSFVKIELERLFEKISPLMKKNTRYKMFAIPLLFVSLVNIVYFLFFEGFANHMIAMVLIYALMAAVGLALYKESKHIKRRMKTMELEHILNRIDKSEVINEYKKQDYITSIKNQPRLGMQAFMNFLAEENERKRMMED
ncbi:hypothetical protein J416_10881 [Gracilibacillus halophilus YIM-C55.5]|uniref:YwnF n=1 Tax=Gracilibacillus halophilus YIM-C55.5 TaxID=1308866 RepID=N4WJT2_9BACI|nr:DUF5392 family protein [Gracilibacillus halophilus]ENH96432.1 hypothetical protein J416_10881 [Gracilibacillus halophilus YIM-C55.5]